MRDCTNEYSLDLIIYEPFLFNVFKREMENDRNSALGIQIIFISDFLRCQNCLGLKQIYNYLFVLILNTLIREKLCELVYFYSFSLINLNVQLPRLLLLLIEFLDILVFL